MSAEGLTAARQKMRAGGVHPAAIEVFAHYHRQLESGATGLVPEADLTPLEHPTRLADLDEGAGEADDTGTDEALDATVVVKLNGGLGTSMGMQQAKSLLPVRDGLTFLDIICRQVLHLRESYGCRLPVVFMDSFRTRDDTLEALGAYPGLAGEGMPLDFLQNREPKLLADDLTPVDWPADPDLEWCPPGHGDLYTALVASGTLEALLGNGFRYAFVSNADNLGATVDRRVASWFADSGAPFASEVCRRTPADRKGGHLAIRRSDGRLVLRETAQTADADADAFADIERHRFFNTNNLWLDLAALQETMRRQDDVLDLPLIRNEKHVDPADSDSPMAIQIETAMGAAVELFEGALALEVDRSRFLPVKATNDLMLLRSDVYDLDDAYRLQFVGAGNDAPQVDLDPAYYKLIADFDERTPDGVPSLREATSLRVEGDWTFGAGVVVRGEAKIDADGSPGTIDPGTVLGAG